MLGTVQQTAHRGRRITMDYFIPIFVFAVILILAGVCFLKLPRIDAGNEDIYGPDFISIDDEREGKY